MEPWQILIVVIVLIAVLFIWLATNRWFWLIVIGIAGLASAFATLASIVHFQILGALGFFFLTVVCYFLFIGIGDY